MFGARPMSGRFAGGVNRVRAIRYLLVSVSLVVAPAGAMVAAEDGTAVLTQAQISELNAISEDLQALRSATTARRDLLARARREVAQMKATIDRLLAESNAVAPPSEMSEAMPVLARVADGKRSVVALRLAAYRDQAQAEQGWALLRTRNGDLLAGAEPLFVAVDLGQGRGQQTRIVVEVAPGGDVCRRLIARGEFCEPAT